MVNFIVGWILLISAKNSIRQKFPQFAPIKENLQQMHCKAELQMHAKLRSHYCQTQQANPKPRQSQENARTCEPGSRNQSR